MELLSQRTQNLLNNQANKLNEYAGKMTTMKLYNPITATEGIINFGVSDNRLMEDFMIERFSQDDTTVWLPEFQYYYNFQGIIPLRDALAKFYQNRLVKNNDNVKISADEIMITNGASAAFALLSQCIAESGEYMLIQTPYYSAISLDIDLTNNHVYYVHSHSENNFVATIDDYKQAFERANEEGKKVSSICIVSPGNPVGTYSSKAEVLAILNFAKEYKLHVIIDEIYAGCIYDEREGFESVLSYFDEIPDPMRTHYLWSFSKDFCSAGLRCGAIYSKNKFLIKALTKMGILFSCPYVVQHRLATILNDHAWLDKFFETNYERIKKAKQLMIEKLDNLNLKWLNCNSGFYLFVDFKQVLSPTLDDKYITFERELQLFDTIFNHGVYITAGQFLNCNEPGWFRIIFCASNERIEEGVRRIHSAILEFKNKFII